MFDSTVKLTNHTFDPTVQSERNCYNGTTQEATNSTIGAIRPCVNGTVEHGHLNTVYPCETWQSAGTCRHQKSRHHKGWPVTGLHPFLTSDMVQHEFKILKLNAKIHG